MNRPSRNRNWTAVSVLAGLLVFPAAAQGPVVLLPERLQPQWSNWTDLGGDLSAAPAVISTAPDRLDVFVIRGSTNRQLLQRVWDGRNWSGWINLGKEGGSLTSAPAAALRRADTQPPLSAGQDRLHLLVRGPRNQLLHRHFPAGFEVREVSLAPPGWLPPAEYTYKVVVTMRFNRSVDRSSFTAPGTVNVDVTSGGRTASRIPGRFRFSDDSRTAVFTSDRNLSDLLTLRAGANILYRITIVGGPEVTGPVLDSGIPTPALRDAGGNALDGDSDSTPGGNHVREFTVVG